MYLESDELSLRHPDIDQLVLGQRLVMLLFISRTPSAATLLFSFLHRITHRYIARSSHFTRKQHSTRPHQPHDPAMPPNPANPCSPSRPKPGPKRGSTWIDPPHSCRPVNLNPPSTASNLALDSQHEEDPTDPTRDDRRRLKRLICLCPYPGQQQRRRRHDDISEPGYVLTRRIYLCDGAVGMLEDGRAEAALDRAAHKMLRTLRCCHGAAGAAGLPDSCSHPDSGA